MTLDTKIYIDKTEQELVKCCDEFFHNDSNVATAAKYSLLNAGKRVRAMLVYLTAQMCGKNWEDYTRIASAVEMVHCYSLIHDDLPCMDNDDLRRGKPSCHKTFKEDTALLAGDALLGCSIEVISNLDNFCDNIKICAIKDFCHAIGPKGMIYGQELDLKFEDNPATKEQLNTIHKNKTGQLILLCGKLGSLGAKLSKPQNDAIICFFENIGIVFQIVDDILDIEGSEEELGKPIGSDGQNNKSTFITLYGLENSKVQAKQLTKQANEALHSQFGQASDNLIEYTNYLLKRKQ